jgi:hypothetical protein
MLLTVKGEGQEGPPPKGGKEQMQNMISGRLAGLEETKISIQLRTGEIKVYPRKELNISLQWVFENMGQPVVCLLQDGVVTDLKPLGQRVAV